MKPIPLPPQEYLLRLFEYDGQYLYWKNPPWNKPFLQGHRISNITRGGYCIVKIDGRIYKVHRIIWKMVYGYDPDEIDHNNHIRHDNSLFNIRDTTAHGNHRNQINSRPECYGLPAGVDFFRNKYRAQGKLNDKTCYLGLYTTPELAHAAWRAFKDGNYTRATRNRENYSVIGVGRTRTR
jgi:hypothetical protein